MLSLALILTCTILITNYVKAVYLERWAGVLFLLAALRQKMLVTLSTRTLELYLFRLLMANATTVSLKMALAIENQWRLWKRNTADIFIKFVAFLETTTGETVKMLRTDGGKEYDNDYLNKFFATSGIVHQTSNSYTPQQNGVSERINRTAMESTRSSLYMNRLTNLFKKTDNSNLELWEEFLKSTI